MEGTPQNPGQEFDGKTPLVPNGGDAMSEGIVKAEIDGFFTTAYDRNVVKYGFASAPINTITRKVGFKMVDSVEYGYFAIGMRDTIGKLALESAYTVQEADADLETPKCITLKVDKGGKFAKTDQIMFRGVNGCLLGKSGVMQEKPYMPFNALVESVNVPGNEISVLLLNAKAGQTIPADCEVIILGSALDEGEARVTPRAATPTPKTNFCQKFMASAAVTNNYLKSAKNANWGLGDIIEMNNKQFVEDIEKSYLFSVRTCVTLPGASYVTYTCAGIIQQMIEGGSTFITIPSNTLDDKTLVKTTAKIFTGNTGSTQRFLFQGMDLFTALLTMGGREKIQDGNDTVTKFEYDWHRIKLGSYTLLGMPHPLLDKYGYSNWGLVLDLKFVERRVFRAMVDDQLDLMKIGVSDTKEVRCFEQSSILLKYPQCHACIIITEAEEEGAAAAA